MRQEKPAKIQNVFFMGWRSILMTEFKGNQRKKGFERSVAQWHGVTIYDCNVPTLLSCVGISYTWFWTPIYFNVCFHANLLFSPILKELQICEFFFFFCLTTCWFLHLVNGNLQLIFELKSLQVSLIFSNIDITDFLCHCINISEERPQLYTIYWKEYLSQVIAKTII